MQDGCTGGLWAGRRWQFASAVPGRPPAVSGGPVTRQLTSSLGIASFLQGGRRRFCAVGKRVLPGCIVAVFALNPLRFMTRRCAYTPRSILYLRFQPANRAAPTGQPGTPHERLPYRSRCREPTAPHRSKRVSKLHCHASPSKLKSLEDNATPAPLSSRGWTWKKRSRKTASHNRFVGKQHLPLRIQIWLLEMQKPPDANAWLLICLALSVGDTVLRVIGCCGRFGVAAIRYFSLIRAKPEETKSTASLLPFG